MFHMSFWVIIVFLMPLALAIAALVTSLRTRRQLEQDISRLEQLLKTSIQRSQAYQNTTSTSVRNDGLQASSATDSTVAPAIAKAPATANSAGKNPATDYPATDYPATDATRSGDSTSTSEQTTPNDFTAQQARPADNIPASIQPVTAQSLEHQFPLEPDVARQPDIEAHFPTYRKPERPHLLEPDEQSLNVVTSIWHSFLQWFKGGNAIVRVGVIVLLVGVILLLRLANDLLTIPIEVRLGGVAIGGVALTLIGLKLRQKRRSYAISIQGAGLAIVYFTLFAAFRLYEILPASLTFALLAILAIVSAALALMQNALPLALLAFGAGFLAPLLTSTGSNNLVGLFSYYLLLNVALAWMAHYKTWKVLNVLGAAMTFGVAGYLGWSSYDDSMRWPLEGLLLAHLALYLFIVVRYSQQLALLPPPQSGQQTRVIAPVDSSLLFGVPLMGFALQAGLLHDIPYALALSSAVLSGLYLALGYKLFYQNKKLVLLTEGVLALGIGFMALVIPLALNAQWTAVGWAVQGAVLVWLGKRQNRIWSVRFGMLLEGLSTLALLWLSFDGRSMVLPLAVYSVCLFIAALLMRQPQVPAVKWAKLPLGVLQPAFLVLLWAFAASQITLNELEQWRVLNQLYWPLHTLQLSLYPLVFGLLALLVSWRIYWPQLSVLIKILMAFLTLHAVFIWIDFGLLFQHRTLLWFTLLAYIVFGLLAIRRISRQSTLKIVMQPQGQNQPQVHLQNQVQPQSQTLAQPQPLSSRFEQAIWVLGLLVYSSVLLTLYWIKQPMVAIIILPLVLMVVLLVGKNISLPLARKPLLSDISIPVSVALLLWIMVANWLSSGQIGGLPYVPLLNLLDICLITAGLVVYRLMAYLPAIHQSSFTHQPSLTQLPFISIKVAQAALGIAAFFTLTSLIIRTLHQWAGTPLWPNGAWQVDLVQTSLTIIWTLCALLLTGLSSRYGWRPVWLAGIALLSVVVIKLLLVDLSNVAAIARIVSFIGAGLIMLLIGYIAPLPPAMGSERHATNANTAGEGKG